MKDYTGLIAEIGEAYSIATKNHPPIFLECPKCPEHQIEMEHVGWGFYGPRWRCTECNITYDEQI